MPRVTRASARKSAINAPPVPLNDLSHPNTDSLTNHTDFPREGSGPSTTRKKRIAEEASPATTPQSPRYSKRQRAARPTSPPTVPPTPVSTRSKKGATRPNMPLPTPATSLANEQLPGFTVDSTQNRPEKPQLPPSRARRPKQQTPGKDMAMQGGDKDTGNQAPLAEPEALAEPEEARLEIEEIKNEAAGDTLQQSSNPDASGEEDGHSEGEAADSGPGSGTDEEGSGENNDEGNGGGGRHGSSGGDDKDDKDDKDDDDDDDDDDNEESEDSEESEEDEAEDEEDDDNDEGDDEGDLLRHYAMSAMGNPFNGANYNRGSELPAALSMLGGMLSMSNTGGRLRQILNCLRQKDDPSSQLMALQDLSEILLVSSEDLLVGSFSPDPYAQELVALMQPNEVTGEENPEIMLLACRCLANLMEAIPASAGIVVSAGAVPVLCQKLLEISFIDLAEQALSTLQKISIDYGRDIVKEGGLTACLSYLEFFATSTQRTAVTTAANCCRDIQADSFPIVRDAMPILLNVLASSDQRVVEKAALCVSRIVESFQHQPSKIEELVCVDLLKVVLRLLLPSSTNHLTDTGLHTRFLRILSISSNDSPRLSAELFKMNVVETLYQILTGVSPPSGTDDIVSRLDSILVMQALAHRPRDQIIETLNVICHLLPHEAKSSLLPAEASAHFASARDHSQINRTRSNSTRIELLSDCKEQVRRFTLVLFPTLMDAYSSTVNLDVRLRALSGQIKMLSNFDREVMLEALHTVPYASFLASIISQNDHPSLVVSALQATELLMSRLGDVYRYQLYREGVITEIEKIAVLPSDEEETSKAAEFAPEGVATELHTGRVDSNSGRGGHDSAALQPTKTTGSSIERGAPPALSDKDINMEGEGKSSDSEGLNRQPAPDNKLGNGDSVEGDRERLMAGDTVGGDEHGGGTSNHPRRTFSSSATSTNSTMSEEQSLERTTDSLSSDELTRRMAKRFLVLHESENSSQVMRSQASQTLTSLTKLVKEISDFYLERHPGEPSQGKAVALFGRLAEFFDSDVFESATSAELLGSGVVHVLESVFSNPDEDAANEAQSAFLQVFMGHAVKSRPETAGTEAPVTPFGILVHKLQDLLSRSENFEVVTVHHNTFNSSQSSAASMLAKQIRLRLLADGDSDTPQAFHSIMVSIHAIATFKTLEDYLRPRLELSNSMSGRAGGISRALATLGGTASNPVPRLRLPGPSTGERPRGPDTPSGDLEASSHSRQDAFGDSNASQSRSLPIEAQASTVHLLHGRRTSKTKKSATPDEGRVSTGNTRPTGVKGNPPPFDAHQPSSNTDIAFKSRSEIRKPTADNTHHSDDMEPVTGSMDEDLGNDDVAVPSPARVRTPRGQKGSTDEEHTGRARNASSRVAMANKLSALAAVLQGVPPTASAPHAAFQGGSTPFDRDWHLEFSLGGIPISSETTVYRAVLQSVANREGDEGRSVWSDVHTVNYRRVPGASPPESSTLGLPKPATREAEKGDANQGHLDKNPVTLSILRLLRTLHDLNASIDDIFVTKNDSVKLHGEPTLHFVNTKLTAKLNRQLEEPLIVASDCLPNWSEDLARLYPFVFPFETRHLFLQSTSFGYARSMSRWQKSQVQNDGRRERRDERPYLGRLQRRKVRISRSKILESAVKVMELYGASQSILEVEYYDEVGTGLGPTLEFYSTVSREFSKKKLKLWRDSEVGNSEFESGPNGLFPRPLSEDALTGADGERIIGLFRALGKFVARSMLDSRIIDIDFNPMFFRMGGESPSVRPSLGAVKVVDPGLARSLLLIKRFSMERKAIDEDPNRTAAQKVQALAGILVDDMSIEDLSLDFTLPGYPDIELVPGGSNISVNIDNVDLYIENVIAKTLCSGVSAQIAAFRSGFSKVFPYTALSAFTPEELVRLFGQIEEDWSLETLMDSIKADHGYTMDSRSVKNLLQVMSELTLSERREFLQFTTGSPKLPIGGFRSLSPMFTVVRKPSEAPYTSDDYLPSVMTCVNYLKLPDYTTMDVLRRQLSTAVKEGQGAFYLS